MFALLSFTWAICFLPIEVLGRSGKLARTQLASNGSLEDDGREDYRPVSVAQAYQEVSNGKSTSINYTLPWPATISTEPNITSQGMNVTSVIPIYETCNLPGASYTSCSPSYQTLTTTKCSTVLTGYFTRHIVSECDEIVTFSTQYGYSLATTTPPASSASALYERDESASLTNNYIHNITTYYAAPWQSIAAYNTSDIRVSICGLYNGLQVCTNVTEVWVIYTEYLPIYHTKAISVSTLVSSTGVLAFDPAVYITITPGTFMLTTQIVSTSLSATNVTSTSTIESLSSEPVDLASSTEDSTTTIYITGPGSTTTMNLEFASPSSSTGELGTRTTTITNTTRATRTTTLTL